MKLNPFEKIGCLMEGHTWRFIRHLGDGLYLYRCTECGVTREKGK